MTTIGIIVILITYIEMRGLNERYFNYITYT